MIFAGTPTAVQLLGISFVTTALAPILTLSPMFTEFNILAPAPIKTLSPIIADFSPFACAIVTCCKIVQFFPITA